MKLAIKKASTDVTVYLFIQDSSKTTGEGLTGLAYNTASLVASYVRPLAARAALSLATQTVTGAHSDGGFVEVDATNMPGVYRLDLSDAVCATGVGSVVVMLKGAANMAPLLLEIQLTDFDLNDASPNVTVADIANDAITAAAYDESTAYPVKSADTGATQIARVGADSDTLETLSDEIAAVKAETALILADTGTDGVKLAADQAVDVTKIGGQAISGNNATLKLKALDIQNSDGNAVNLVSTGSNGNGLMAVGNGNGAGAGFTGGETGMGLYAIGGTTSGHGVYASGRGATSSDGMVAQSTQRRGFSMSGAVQGLLVVDDETESGVKLANNAITAAKIAVDAIGADEIAAGAVTKIQNGLATPTNITAGTITTVTNLTNLPAMPADWITAAGVKADAVTKIATGVWASATRTLSSFGTLVSDIWGAATRTLSAFGFTVATNSDANVTAIKAKTDNLPASPAAVGSAMTLTSGERTAIANEVEAQIIDDTDAEKVLKAITDKIASVNPSLDDLTLAGIASAVRTELTTELARIDAAISTRLATAGYTAPANADISTIKSKTDNLPASPAASGEYTSALSAIQADLDNPNQYKADVSALALEATLTAIKGAGWTNQTLEKIVSDIAAIATGSGASVADILNALLASYTVSGSVGESLGRLDNIQAKTDLITTGTTLTIASAVVGSTITAHRGDTLTAALENIGALTNNSKLWFTVKRDFDDADSAAVVQIEKTGGLLFINGAAGTTGNGSLTINDVASGDVTIVLNASETAKLSPGNYQYDIQILRSAGTPVSTLTYGEFVVAADVTKATA